MGASGEPIKEEALLIRSIRHRESSRIATFFGIEHGKFSAIAKGARRSRGTSPLAGAQPPCHVEVIAYHKSSRSVQTLAQTFILDAFSHLKSDLEQNLTAAVITQYIDHCFTDGEANAGAIRIAVDALMKLDGAAASPALVLWEFQLNLIRLIGFGVELTRCPICRSNPAALGLRNRFLYDVGAICCAGCTPNGNGSSFTLSGESVGILRAIERSSTGARSRLKPSRAARGELTRALAGYIDYHHPPARKSTALAILNQLDHPSKTLRSKT